MKQLFLLITATTYWAAIAQNFVPSGGESAFLSFATCNLNSVTGSNKWTTARTATPGVYSFRENAGFANGTSILSSVTATPASWVNGYVKYYGSASNSFIYPVGSASARRFVKTVNVPANHSVTTAWIDGDPTSTPDPTDATLHDRTSKQTGITAVSSVGQWDWIATAYLASIAVSVNVPISFTNTTNLIMVGWDGTRWIDLGNTSLINDGIGNILTANVPSNVTALTIGTRNAGGVFKQNQTSGPIPSKDFKIYPNPTSGQVTLEFESAKTESGILKLYNVSGKLVFEQTLKLESGSNVHTVNISKVAQGVYSLSLQSSDGQMQYQAQQLIIN